MNQAVVLASCPMLTLTKLVSGQEVRAAHFFCNGTELQIL